MKICGHVCKYMNMRVNKCDFEHVYRCVGMCEHMCKLSMCEYVEVCGHRVETDTNVWLCV